MEGFRYIGPTTLLFVDDATRRGACLSSRIQRLESTLSTDANIAVVVDESIWRRRHKLTSKIDIVVSQDSEARKNLCIPPSVTVVEHPYQAVDLLETRINRDINSIFWIAQNGLYVWGKKVKKKNLVQILSS
jgi:hypothetical protein